MLRGKGKSSITGGATPALPTHMTAREWVEEMSDDEWREAYEAASEPCHPEVVEDLRVGAASQGRLSNLLPGEKLSTVEQMMEFYGYGEAEGDVADQEWLRDEEERKPGIRPTKWGGKTAAGASRGRTESESTEDFGRQFEDLMAKTAEPKVKSMGKGLDVSIILKEVEDSSDPMFMMKQYAKLEEAENEDPSGGYGEAMDEVKKLGGEKLEKLKEARVNAMGFFDDVSAESLYSNTAESVDDGVLPEYVAFIRTGGVEGEFGAQFSQVQRGKLARVAESAAKLYEKTGESYFDDVENNQKIIDEVNKATRSVEGYESDVSDEEIGITREMEDIEFFS